MDLTYSHAVVSYCPDLTSGKEAHMPVGILLIGQVEAEEGIAAIYVPSIRSPRPDDITNEVLRAVPQLLRLHVEDALSQDRTRPPLSILKSLHEKLRNSLYVSKILGPTSLELGEATEQILQHVMSSVLPDLYEEALEQAGWQLAPQSAPEGAGAAATTPKSVALGNIPMVSNLYGLSQIHSDEQARV